MSGEPEVDLAHIHWYSPEWIYALPSKTLSTPAEAMDYFALSPFFDPLSNNNNLRVQRMVTDPFYGYAKAQFELPRYVSGFEYVLAHTLPPDLYVIHRREITDKGSRNNVTGIWFILEGKIYPAPNVYDTMATRLKNASHLISTAFTSLAAAHPPSNPRAHPVWRSLPPDVSAPDQQQEKAIDSTETDPSSADAERQSTLPNFALLNALQSTRNSISDLSTLAQKPATRIEPQDELRKIEEEIMGLTTAQPTMVGPGTIRSSSAVPSQRDRAISTAGTPAFRMLGPRTPGTVAASSPLTSLHFGP